MYPNNLEVPLFPLLSSFFLKVRRKADRIQATLSPAQAALTGSTQMHWATTRSLARTQRYCTSNITSVQGRSWYQRSTPFPV